MKSHIATLTFTVLLLFAPMISAQTPLVVSGSKAIVSSGSLTISNYPYNKPFPVSDAKWIWNQNWGNSPRGQTLTFFSQFRLKDMPKKITLYITCDNYYRAYVNGYFLGNGNDWTRVDTFDVPTYFLDQGRNTLEIVAGNAGGPAALIYALVAT